ncbi:germin-like protein subfamily T member 2, partial [Dorcoceras hygrometricum]
LIRRKPLLGRIPPFAPQPTGYSTRSVLGKCVYLVTLAMSLFDLKDVCIAIGSLATLDLPMVVDLIGIYGLKGPYCTLTTTDWFLQAQSVIPRGSWGDVARRFTMIRWAVVCYLFFVLIASRYLFIVLPLPSRGADPDPQQWYQSQCFPGSDQYELPYLNLTLNFRLQIDRKTKNRNRPSAAACGGSSSCDASRARAWMRMSHALVAHSVRRRGALAASWSRPVEAPLPDAATMAAETLRALAARWPCARCARSGRFVASLGATPAETLHAWIRRLVERCWSMMCVAHATSRALPPRFFVGGGAAVAGRRSGEFQVMS